MSLDALLQRPVWLAPMAGGVGTVDLAAAVADAGGAPSIAAGYLTPDALAADIRALRERTAAPIVANVFVPQPRVAAGAELDGYAALLEPAAERLGAQVGAPRHDDDHYPGKLDVLEALRPELATFTFGLPAAEDVRRMHAAGVAVGVTVTDAAEGRAAIGVGADALIAQSSAAGGHRSVHDLRREPGQETAEGLIGSLAPLGVPVIVAGGIMEHAQVAQALDAGAAAVSCGTAFMLAPEAGTSALHRAALRDRRFDRTVVTRAFTGRPARALANEWTALGETAPAGYPELHWMTKGIRAAAREHGNADWLNLWAGQGWQRAHAAPARQIIASLEGRHQ